MAKGRGGGPWKYNKTVLELSLSKAFDIVSDNFESL